MLQWNLSTKAMLGVKSFDPCREFGCFQRLFFIVVDHCVPFTLAVVKSQVVLQSPFVERFHCISIWCVQCFVSIFGCGLLCISFGLVLCPVTITLLYNERSKSCKVIHSKDELSVIVKCCDVVY